MKSFSAMRTRITNIWSSFIETSPLSTEIASREMGVRPNRPTTDGRTTGKYNASSRLLLEAEVQILLCYIVTIIMSSLPDTAEKHSMCKIYLKSLKVSF